MLIIGTLADGPVRYSDLGDAIPGISQRMLTLTLKQLRRTGLVSRTSYPEVPPRVEYTLTEKGRALIPIIESMRAYGREWLAAGGECAEAPATRVLASVLA